MSSEKNSKIRGLPFEEWVKKHPHEFLMSIIHFVRDDAYHMHVLVNEMKRVSKTRENEFDELEMTVDEILDYISKDIDKIMQVMTLASGYAEKHRWDL